MFFSSKKRLFRNSGRMAIQDKQAIAKAIGKSHKQRRGRNLVLQRERRKLREAVLNPSPLEKSESSG